VEGNLTAFFNHLDTKPTNLSTSPVEKPICLMENCSKIHQFVEVLIDEEKLPTLVNLITNHLNGNDMFNPLKILVFANARHIELLSKFLLSNLEKLSNCPKIFKMPTAAEDVHSEFLDNFVSGILLVTSSEHEMDRFRGL
jgi:hypothetical protein